MAIDLTGIANQNEFFTQHYLSAVFEQDLKDRLKAWADAAAGDEGERAPYDRIGALRKDYFAMQEGLTGAGSSAEVLVEQRGVLQQVAGALGYAWRAGTRTLEDGRCCPIAGEVKRADGSPWMWILEVAGEPGEPSDPLACTFLPEQYPDDLDPALRMTDLDLETLITRQLFTVAEPPRWLLVLQAGVVLLIDRSKWSEKRMLQFDLREILDRREASTLKAMAALLHREHICPDSGASLLDTLDENSHKHAFSVSEDLKYSAREAVELLGNEAVYYLRYVRKEGVFDKALADQLTKECLRYLYRMLFLFYLEARPEKLGYIPMKNAAYSTGYSLDSLRELEMVPLNTPEAQNGTFFDESIRLLFRLIGEGFEPKDQQEMAFDGPLHDEFRLDRVESHLFDPSLTPLLNKVKIRNSVWQQIIRLLSLTRPEKGKNKRRGRVSYAQLGIIQLGAVYEGLLSYRGFFAETDLYEVKKAKDEWNPLHQAYFVPAEALEHYSKDEKVFEKGGKVLKKHEKGTFIYRLAGRDREKSASYYTPTSLTQCLVKYALKELIGEKKEDPNWKTADEILNLTVCEPAMGSAAFLNEAVNQLADAYIRRKQVETDTFIPHDRIEEETQKVRMVLADNNVFGIDLNPIAVELAEISLWLNSIHAGQFVPWFGFQLQCGNSLVGARRQVFDSRFLTAKKDKKNLINRKERTEHKENAEAEDLCDPSRSLRLKNAEAESTNREARKEREVMEALRAGQSWFDVTPERVGNGVEIGSPSCTRQLKAEGPSATRRSGAGMIYHFLLPDPGMADFGDKIIKKMAKTELDGIKTWKKDFLEPFSVSDIRLLERLSLAVDRLWAEHTRQLARLRAETTDHFPFFGHEDIKKSATGLSLKDKKLRQEYFSENIRNSSPYRRLKMVMDYWCALWFWPIQEVENLPTRDEYLLELQFILEGSMLQEYGATDDPNGQMLLFPETAPRQEMLDLAEKLGRVDVDGLCEKLPRLNLVKKLAETHRFLHWELEFADIFAENGGFDLVLGNPPWIKVEWNESGLLSDFQPLFAVKKLSASKVADLRAETIEKFGLLDAYYDEYVGQAASQNFLNAFCNYPLLKNVQTNLYKCFLPQAWMIGNAQGVSGFVHPEGVYDDPKGGKLRREIYARLRDHFQFQNGLFLFPEVAHRERYSVNIYGEQENPNLVTIANLFTAATVDESFIEHSPLEVGGIKDDNNNWNTVGHPDRVIHVGQDELELFARLYDEPGTPWQQARLPSVHSVQVLDVLRKFAAYPKRLGDLEGEYYSCEMWHETNAQKDHTIRRETQFPESPRSLILSGPHFYVGNPFYKSPREVCTEKGHYDVIDLTQMPADYLPRTNYVPDCDPAEYRRRTPSVPWDETGNTKVTDCYRLFFRRQLSQSGERTMTCTVQSPNVGHIHPVNSFTFSDESTLVCFAACCSSIVYDFMLKTTGKGDLYESVLRSFPFVELREKAWMRFLMLSSLTELYSDLWCNSWNNEFVDDHWLKTDPRLPADTFSKLTSDWQWEYPLRTDYARRQALVEIDVLVARALGLTVDELCAIYRIQFPVLRQNENDTWYDRNGRIIFTCSKGLPGVGFSRPEWNEIKDMPSGTVERIVTDNWLPEPQERTIIYKAPFDRCDREEDYRIVWKALDEREEC